MATELVIYTDESDKYGEYFSNFYGGILVRSTDAAEVIGKVEACKLTENLHQEIKWQKVTENYLAKYVAVTDTLFDLLAEDAVKIRIMFTSNQYIPVGLTSEQKQSEYHRLYYQFIKHAFGLQHCNAELRAPVRVRLNIDQMPTGREATAQFKSYLDGLSHIRQLREAGIKFDRHQIAEVNSREHVLLQCIDVVLGAMSFRLNNKHKLRTPGSTRRGKRTIAKEKLYRHILGRIRKIYPNFNVGESTGIQADLTNRWRHPYRHWKFIPRDHRRDVSRAKP